MSGSSTSFTRGENPLRADKLNTALAERLLRSGDTMTGKLTLSGDPSTAFQAATKQYVDAKYTGINLTSYLPISGGIMTGPFTLSGDPTNPLHGATKQYVDTSVSAIGGTYLPFTGGTVFGTLTLTSPIPLAIVGAAGGFRTIRYRSSVGNPGTDRWQVGMDNATETGVSNAGSNFAISATGDSGFGVGIWLSINRNSGATVLLGALTIGGGSANTLTTTAGAAAASSVVLSQSGSGLITLGGAVPISTDNSTAVATTAFVRSASDARYLPLTGGSLSSGLAFTGGLGASSTDLTKQINLSGGNYGFSITAGRLNLVSNSQIYAVIVGTDVARFDSGGLSMFKSITLTAGNSVNFASAANAFGSNGDSAGVAQPLANAYVSTFNGFAIQSGINNQRMPFGMNALAISGRDGSLTTIGNLVAMNAATGISSQIQNLRFYNTALGGDQMIDTLLSSAATLASTTPAAGGSGWAVNDRAYDIYANTYTVMAVDGGNAVTTLRMDTFNARVGAAPGNPVTLTAAPNFTGTGLTANLTWTPPTRLVLRGPNAGVFVALSTTGTSVTGPIGFNSTLPIAKPTVSGAKASNAALASLISALTAYGLIFDTTTA